MSIIALWLVVVISVIVIVSIASLIFALQLDSQVAGGRFINEDEAAQIIKDTYHVQHVEPEFGYVEYEGTKKTGSESYAKFSWYSADPESLASNMTLVRANITRSNVILEKDSYVWTGSTEQPESFYVFFIDAETGKVLGRWGFP